MSIVSDIHERFNDDKNIITDFEDSDLTHILSMPVHRNDLFKRIMADFSPSKQKSYRRPIKKLPRRKTRRKKN